MGLYSGRLIIGRIFACEIWGAYIFFFGGGEGGACHRNFMVWEENLWTLALIKGVCLMRFNCSMYTPFFSSRISTTNGTSKQNAFSFVE